MILETSIKHLTIRPFQKEDAQRMAELANNPAIARNLRDMFPSPYRLEDAREYIASLETIETPNRFAICFHDEIVGGIGLHSQPDIFRINMEIGYWLGEPHWGKGWMTEAIKVITRYGFEHFPIERIFAGIFDHNIGSERALLKAGYEKEATLKKSMIKEGKIFDQVIFSYRKEMLNER